MGPASDAWDGDVHYLVQCLFPTLGPAGLVAQGIHAELQIHSGRRMFRFRSTLVE
jgi:hypothetical protein